MTVLGVKLEAGTPVLTGTQVYSDHQCQLRHNCVRKLAEHIKGSYISVCDPMAGLGDDITTLMVDPHQTWVNDRDARCLEALHERGFPNITTADLAIDPESALHQADLFFMDYNTFTIRRFDTDEMVFKGEKRGQGYGYRGITNLVFQYAARFVIINDCTVHGIRNWPHTSKPCAARILGKPVTSVDDYFQALPDYFLKFYPDWDLTTIAPFHTNKGAAAATAYLLFERR